MADGAALGHGAGTNTLRREPDWIIDAEIALYHGRGWTWESIGAFFGMSDRAARRRYERYRRYEGDRRAAYGKPVEE